MDNIIQFEKFKKGSEDHRKIVDIYPDIEAFVFLMSAKRVSEFSVALDCGDQEFVLTLSSKHNETHA